MQPEALREARAAARDVGVALGEAREDRPHVQQRRGARSDVVHARAIIVAQISRENAGEIARMMVGGKRGRNEGGNGGSQHQAHGKRSPCN